MKSSKSWILIAGVFMGSAQAWSQEKCDFAFLGDSASSFSEPLRQLVGNDFNMALTDSNLLLLDKIVNQNQAFTPELKASFQITLRDLTGAVDRTDKKNIEALLQRKITFEEAAAVKLARGIGRNERGRNDDLQGFSGNYTDHQLARKDRLLELAGFSFEDRLALQTSKMSEDILVNFKAENLMIDNIIESPAQAMAMNQELLNQMGSLSRTFKGSEGRKPSLSKKEARDLYEAVTRHPVARILNLRKYDPDSRMGFCFGRAMTTHLEALSRGVEKDSIRKVFVTGEMKAIVGDIIWQFHVATAVKSTDGGWWVVDPFVGQVVTLEGWYAKMKANDKTGTLRLYATEASRMGATDSHRYNKIHLMEGYYNNYFKDILDYYGKKAKEELPKKSVWIRIFDWALSMVRLGI